MVALHATVHDGTVTLLGDTLFGDLGIDPVGESPHVGADLAKLDGTRGVVANRLLEGLVEVAVVEEDVGVVVPAVEVALEGANGLDDTIELLVSGENDKGSVGAGLLVVGHLAAGEEDLVVLFANLADGGRGSSWRENVAVGAGMANKEDEDEDDDNQGEEDHDAEGDRDGRVSS